MVSGARDPAGMAQAAQCEKMRIKRSGCTSNDKNHLATDWRQASKNGDGGTIGTTGWILTRGQSALQLRRSVMKQTTFSGDHNVVGTQHRSRMPSSCPASVLDLRQQCLFGFSSASSRCAHRDSRDEFVCEDDMGSVASKGELALQLHVLLMWHSKIGQAAGGSPHQARHAGASGPASDQGARCAPQRTRRPRRSMSNVPYCWKMCANGDSCAPTDSDRCRQRSQGFRVGQDRGKAMSAACCVGVPKTVRPGDHETQPRQSLSQASGGCTCCLAKREDTDMTRTSEARRCQRPAGPGRKQ